MQKLKQGRGSTTVHETVLYLDDFLAILQLFNDHCDSVKVTVEDYLLDDPGSEIFQLKDRLNRTEVFRLNIEGKDFYSTQELIDLLGKSADDLKTVEELRSQKRPKYLPVAELTLWGGGYGTLDYDADDLRAIGLKTCILESLRYRKLRRFIRAHPWLYSLGGALVLSPSILALRWSAALKSKPAIYSIAVAVGCVLSSILFMISMGRDKRLPVLRLERRGESRNFFRRKRDDLLFMLLSAIVGASLALLVQSLLRPPTQNITNSVPAPKR
jgi:hypothetical protein